jgi:aspartyl-tRNA(Asn)/glutamyl-tRNA(Gln) amidotransferase subunit C
MSLTPEEVSKIALLARLELTEEESTTFTAQLDHILDYFRKLETLDTTAVEATAHVVEVEDAFRDDAVTNPPAGDELRANAPATDGTLFRVPKIIE